MNHKTYPRVVIAGIKGGCGKTTVTLGLIGALSQKMKVIPYKKGPDYIDAGWMSFASKSPCYNLDPYLIGRDNVLDLFVRYFDGDIAIIEGNRGLYDGVDAEGSFSTAEVSKIISSPVILVVDCTKTTRTVAAIVLGCMKMDDDVLIRGVILNQIANKRHESVIRQSIEKYCGIPVVGVIPRLSSIELPERHLGLVPTFEHSQSKVVIDSLTDMANKHLDLDAILRIANSSQPFSKQISTLKYQNKAKPDVRIGVIRDEAFQFYYQENIDALSMMGADVLTINSMTDNTIKDVDALYIGGGFPETNVERLEKNHLLRTSIRSAIFKGIPVYAECGGLMYLGQTIFIDEKSYEMVGVFPINFRMNKKPQGHGYTEVEVYNQNPFYPVNTIIRGHEFHYSSAHFTDKWSDFAFIVKRGKGIINGKDGIFFKNCLATYTHIHAYGCKYWAEGLINKAKEYRHGL
ncbi:MAG: hydrogenobyrinic acid a,c-diamide synthase (glutamine-hydrolyzing) [Thermodesulfovibrionales bacterium]|nr:hydrogenobyrinic acid a,c-diamide synthase (glutamine-hydrolyzing) [Thermodesulfovibrionales bacterium]